MPNCTAYAYGRAYEILGSEPNLCWASAGQWYDYNRENGCYAYGKTPKVGAVACWNYGTGGHVAIVESIDSNGYMTLSNSAWQSTNFYLTHAYATDSNPGGNSWWTFQGYIYLIDSPTVVETEATVPTTTAAPVQSSYGTGTYQVDAQPYLNVRASAGLSYGRVGSIADTSKIIITETAYSDGLDWGYTTYQNVSGWVALSYCKYLSSSTQTEVPTTVAPTTVAPTTVPATTAAPTTVPATTVAATHFDGVGDIDGDGCISILDATLIQKYLARMMQMKHSQMKLADFNRDGAVNIDDVTEIQRYLLVN